MNHRTSVLSEHHGVSIVIALLFLLVLTIIGISAIHITIFETNLSGNERLYHKAFYLADAGIDYFYGKSNAYLLLPDVKGTIDSRHLPAPLEGGYFVIRWKKIGEETGPPKKVEFLVISEGVSTSFPTAGRAKIEAVIETVDQEPPPEYSGGSS